MGNEQKAFERFLHDKGLGWVWFDTCLASSGAGLSRGAFARESAGMDSPTSSDVPSPLLAEKGTRLEQRL